MNMNRRDFLKVVGYASLTPATANVFAENTHTKKPNVVIIVTDDQYEFGFLSGKATTPNIDKIVKEGIYLSRAYTTAACTPTRYNILTGKYATSSKSRQMLEWVSKEGQYNIQWNTSLYYEDEPMPMPKYFQKNGYFTGGVGKTHNNVRGNRQQNQQMAKAKANLAAITDYTSPKFKADMNLYQQALNDSLKTVGFDYTASIVAGNLDNGPSKFCNVHNQEWMTKGAIDFLTEVSKQDKPFFLYFATTLEHGPHEKRRSLDEDPRKCSGGYLDKPITGYQPSRESVMERAAKITKDGKFGSVIWLDDGIGAIMDKLKAMGAADNTIVIYLSDHTTSGKASCYDGGAKTPVVVRWTKSFKSGECHALTHTIDIFPTLIDLCGLPEPKGLQIDGLDMADVLYGKQNEARKALLVEWGSSRAVVTSDNYKYIALRHPESVINREDYEKSVREFRKTVAEQKLDMTKIITDPTYHPEVVWPFDQSGRYTSMRPGGTYKQPARNYYKTIHDSDQLYDLNKDPGEQNNLAYKPEYKTKLAEMKKYLTDLMRDRPGSFAEFKTIGNQEKKYWEDNYKKYHTND